MSRKKKNNYINGANETYVNKMMNRVGSKIKREQLDYIIFNQSIPLEMKMNIINSLPEKDKKRLQKRMKMKMLKNLFF